MMTHFKLYWLFALAFLVLSGCGARAMGSSASHAAGSNVSYAAGSQFALFIFHFDSSSTGQYLITHISGSGGVATDTYRFVIRRQSGRAIIGLTKDKLSCGRFRASITPQLLRLFLGNSKTAYFNRVSDSALAADLTVVKQEASNLGTAGAREILSHKSGTLWLACTWNMAESADSKALHALQTE
ncbi:MAG: hypothetical protein ABR949_15620 [Candidatus Aquilonibacter sp.]|jgi:hypothetical protein